MGPAKNRCKKGDYYWVNAYVTPIKGVNGENVEYQSVRTRLDPNVKNRAEKLYPLLNNGQTPAALKVQTDQTLWLQVIFALLALMSVIGMATSTMSFMLGLLMLILSGIATGLFFNWRSKYQLIVEEATAVFDNPLMTYLYSGNNDAIGKIHLALSMRKAEINAIVGRVTDVSLHVSECAGESSDKSSQVSMSLNTQRSESDQVATAINEMSATVQDLARTIDEEVRALAMRTQQSTEDINELLQNLQKNSDNAVNAMKVSNDLSENCVSLSQETDQALSNIHSEVAKISDSTAQIATAIEEQSVVTEQVSQNVVPY